MGGPTSESAEPASEEPSPDVPSLGTTASRGFLWANLGIFTRYVTALILAAVLARVLSPVDYAVMVTLMLITFYFDNALDLGMGAALVYEQEEGVSERVQVASGTPLLVVAGLPLPVAVAVLLPLPLAVWLAWQMSRGAWRRPAAWNALGFWSIGLLMSSAGLELVAFVFATTGAAWLPFG